jgi:SAM-dependent methyltransferase
MPGARSTTSAAAPTPTGRELAKLHLGCGKRYIPGFVHVDLDDFPHIDHRHDIRSLPMFRDNSASLIYVCHALEYFDRVEVMDVLSEWRRVLAPRGILRVAVPDFEALALAYQKYRDLNRIIGPLFGRIAVSTPSGPATAYHRTTYDFDSLATVLRDARFENPRRWDWRKVEHGNVDDFSQAYIPHMDKDHGQLISLNVEADKAR